MADLRRILGKKLTESEHAILRKSFDIIGDIAVVEIPEGLRRKKKLIAAAIMESHTNIKSVWMEKTGRKGKLRLQKLEWLAGEKRTETVAVENGARLSLDVAKVYYSPRMASERKRIYVQVRKPENVLVMFSGAAPYVIELAKHTPARKVYGVEVNRTAHKYAVANAEMNKVENKARLYCGDVKKVLPKLKMRFDRIAMPLPKGAYVYLPLALKHIKKGGIVHYYDFLPETGIPTAAIERVADAAEKMRKKVSILKVAKCGQLAPRQYRVCVDFKVL